MFYVIAEVPNNYVFLQDVQFGMELLLRRSFCFQNVLIGIRSAWTNPFPKMTKEEYYIKYALFYGMFSENGKPAKKPLV
jgi:hypothetical protein